MDKQTALALLDEYAVLLERADHAFRPHEHMSHQRLVARDAAGMSLRFPETGSTRKAMRWLGYIQGVCVCWGLFTLEEVKEHSKRGWVIR